LLALALFMSISIAAFVYFISSHDVGSSDKPEYTYIAFAACPLMNVMRLSLQDKAYA
jgi:hypothetical protein